MKDLSDKEIRRIIKDLKPRMFHTPTFEEQGKGITALGSLKDERCIRPLSQMLFHRDKNIRILAINSIKEIKSEKILPILQHCLTDDEISIRELAKTAIDQMKSRI
ncbi:MAG TPA: HEAT repeat domain-containing protein [Pyrinomonadaceae bacterium]|jgi:HEAT repeat protein